jgi:hypothetical protein
MLKYCFLKGHGSKLIPKKLVITLQDKAISVSTANNWLRKLKSGDLSCGDEEWPGRSLGSLGLALQRFLKKCPFASVRVMAGHFSVDRCASTSILDRALGLGKLAPR